MIPNLVYPYATCFSNEENDQMYCLKLYQEDFPLHLSLQTTPNWALMQLAFILACRQKYTSVNQAHTFLSAALCWLVVMDTAYNHERELMQRHLCNCD